MSERIAVSSSNIRSVRYEPESEMLEVEFVSGGVYQYTGVPSWEIEAMMSSDSKGKYFIANVKSKYPCVKL